MAALKLFQVVLIALFVSKLLTAALAQSSSSCSSALSNLSPCLGYITGSSASPSRSCCSQLASVVQSEPQCLCALVGGGAGLGITINQTQVLALPAACNVQALSVISQCKSSPGNQSPPSAGTPLEPNSPPGSGSNNAPISDIGSANGSYAEICVPLVITLLLMVAFSTASAVTAFEF